MLWLPVFDLNVPADVDACDCTRGLYGQRERVCTESWLWEKIPLPHASILCLSFRCDAPPDKGFPWPITWLKYCWTMVIIIITFASSVPDGEKILSHDIKPFVWSVPSLSLSHVVCSRAVTALCYCFRSSAPDPIFVSVFIFSVIKWPELLAFHLAFNVSCRDMQNWIARGRHCSAYDELAV